jgi:glycosyltransferase involved in cell wall biosynthesis
MTQHLVFMHQTYPAQFGPITQFLLKNYNVEITFLSQFTAKIPAPGIKHIAYQAVKTGHETSPYFFSRYFEQEVASMHGLYNTLKAEKINPDVLIGHVAFGNMGLLHVDYPEIPRIGFFELFYNPFGDTSDHRPEYPAQKPNRLRVPLRNATQLVELEYCTKGYSPTKFQHATYPEAYRNKLSVLFDGIDTTLYQPEKVGGKTTELPVSWPKGVKIVTYVSRGLEAMRGFDLFMKIAHQICKIRPDVHFVIAGNPKTHYGSEMTAIQEETFKDHVLKQAPYDLSRFHFLNWISELALVDLYRLSDCHVYWTVPFTLSWSLFQALSTGCLIVASNSAPVKDAIINGETGLLVEPYDVAGFTQKIAEVLDNPEAFQPLREAARQQMVEQFGFEVCLPKLAQFYLN